ncbi:hypothetical protein N3K66_005401 [Trichothecium roseum]|uniref:Uncharacterized protein n=1 Tax=Trichothecium roseum TaxID=47278 RepID=A0ACC0V0E0_9HYPO|nr:hypothetical protein N3K66_005401 [Trichothecium roseum]
MANPTLPHLSMHTPISYFCWAPETSACEGLDFCPATRPSGYCQLCRVWVQPGPGQNPDPDLDLKELIDLSEAQLNEYARQRYVVRNGTEVGFEPPYERWEF